MSEANAHSPSPPRSRPWAPLVVAGIGLVLLWLLYRSTTLLFTSLVVSVALHYALGPVVDFLEARSINRTAGSALVLGVIIIAIWLAWSRLIGVGLDIQRKIDVQVFQKNLVHQAENATAWIERELPIIERLFDPKVPIALQPRKESTAKLPTLGTAPTLGTPPTLAERSALLLEKEIVGQIPGAIRTLATALPNLILIPYMTFFLLRDAKLLRRAIIVWAPNHYFETSMMFLYELDRRMRSYLQALFLDCLLVGLLVGIGSAIVGAPYPIAFGLIAFVLNSIPLLGPLLYGTICTFITIGAGKPPEVVFAFLGLFVLSRLCDDLIIVPTIYGRSHHLHPLAVVAGVLLGESFAGAWGMFLAIPITSILLLGVAIFRELSTADTGADSPPWAFKPFA